MNMTSIKIMSTAIRWSAKRLRSTVALPVLALIVAACVTHPTPDIGMMRIQPQPAIVAVATPGVTIPAGASFAWLPGSIHFHKDQRMQDSTLQNMIERGIRQNLQAMGYRFVDSASASDFSIGYTAALESALNDDEIMHRFGLLPGSSIVTAGSAEYEKGTLIIYVMNAAGHDVVWRSAVQAGVDLTVGDAEREQRLDGLLKDMFQTFPTAEK
jgi:Domain of unknown function (DUF4136)